MQKPVTRAQVRALFWETFPELPRRRFRYSWTGKDKTAELVHHCDTRCAFVDFIDALHRSGQITDRTANEITIGE
jgi:hypothetical protein